MSHRHSRKGKKHSRRHSKRNLLKKSFDKVKSTSKRIMPKVKSGLENVGSRVTTTAVKAVPFLQNSTRSIFEQFSLNKTRKHRKH